MARAVIARTVQFGRIFVVVARFRVRASCDFKWVADAVAVRIEQALAGAVVSRVGKFTCRGVDRGGVVVAGRRAQATSARREFTAVVVDVGSGVVVARGRVLATWYRGDARAVVVCCIRVVVQRRAVRAAFDFIGIANAVAVRVGQAVSVAVVPRLCEIARAIRDDG